MLLKFRALLWRHYISKRRYPIRAILEILIPFALLLIMLWPRNLVEKVDVEKDLRYLTDLSYDKCPIGIYGPRPENLIDLSQLTSVGLNLSQASDLICDKRIDSLIPVTLPFAPSLLPFYPRRDWSFSVLPFVTAGSYKPLLFSGVDNGQGCKTLHRNLNLFMDSVITKYKFSLGYRCVEELPDCVPGEGPEQPYVLDRPEKGWFQKIDNSDEEYDDDNPYSHAFVVIDCKEVSGNNVDVKIRMNQEENGSLTPYPMSAILKSFPYDLRDIFPSTSLTAQYGGSASSTNAPSYLDYLVLVSNLAHLNDENYSPERFPEEVTNILRSLPSYTRKVPPVSWSYSFSNIEALCYLCHSGYSSVGSNVCPMITSAILLSNLQLGAAWQKLISAPPVSVSPYLKYCDYQSVGQFYFLYNDLTNSTTTEIRGGIEVVVIQNIIKIWMEKYNSIASNNFKFSKFHQSFKPTTKGSYDSFIEANAGSTGFVMLSIATLLLLLYRAVLLIMHDKENRIREILRIFGVPDWLSWLSAYVFLLGWMWLTCIPMCFVLKAIIPGTSFIAPFLLYSCFSLATTSYSIFVSAFFSKGRTAALVASAGYFLMLSAYTNIEDGVQQASIVRKMFCMLLPPSAFGWGLNTLLGAGVSAGLGQNYGLKANQLTQTFSGVSVLAACGFLILDAVLYLIVGAYIHQLLPGEFGTPKPWYFVFDKSWWCGSTVLNDGSNNDGSSIVHFHKQNDDFMESAKESEDGEFVEFVQIKNLNVSFPVKNFYGRTKGKFDAVKGVSLTVREGEILALLGHNGAGKTTLINVLSGMLGCTGGEANVCGYDVTKNIEYVRRNIGYCPQHDAHFPFLTVKEHLVFFGNLKGMKGKDLEDDLQDIVKILDLQEKLNFKSSSLSGGQQRRLSVAISLIGGSKVILLDEPSTGIDPATRRALWDTLKLVKKGRSIILTTHFMEEAEVLGDRIAIMADGQLKCLGTTLFLKSKLGLGYTLTMTKVSEVPPEILAKTRQMILEQLPNSSPLSDVALELSFRVPFDCSQLLCGVLEVLERDKESLGISSFSLGVTSLEEVFLLIGGSGNNNVVASSKSQNEHKRKDVQFSRIDNLSFANEDENYDGRYTRLADDTDYNVLLTYKRGRPRLGRKLVALVKKRWIAGLRDFVSLAWQVVLPLALATWCLGTGMSFINGRMPKAVNYEWDLIKYPYAHLLPQTVLIGINGSSSSTSELTTLASKCLNNDIFKPEIIENLTLEAFEDKLLNMGAQVTDFISIYLEDGKPPKIIHDNRYIHSFALGLHYLTNCIFSEDTSTTKFIIQNDLLQRTDSVLQIIGQVSSVIWILITVAAIVTSMATYSIKERESGAKTNQHICGTGVCEYWLSSILYDMFIFVFTFTLLVLIFLGFGSLPTTKDRIGTLFLAGYLFGIASSTFAPFISLFVPSQIGLQATLGILGTFTPIIGPLLYTLPQTRTAYEDWLKYFFLLVPHGAFTEAIIGLCWKWSSTSSESQFAWDNSGAGITFLVIDAIVYGIALCLVDWVILHPSFLSRKEDTTNSYHELQGDIDSDVAEEQRYVEQIVEQNNGDDIEHSFDNNVLILRHLRKEYKKRNLINCKTTSFTAVHDLSFRVTKAQCFGFLGANGAGKTTTLQVLTCSIASTAGTALLNGKDINHNVSHARASIGYCPQKDPLFDNLTGLEHLYLYGRLSGIEERDLPMITQEVLKILNLKQYANRLTKRYSGGNKRKLTLGIGLLKNPELLFLDEPSSGVDPGARRKLWQLVDFSVKNNRKSVVLTTHSMEECEALCDRVAIIKKGNLICIGTVSHLKHKFGNTYQLNVTFEKQGDTYIEELQKHLPPDSKLVEHVHGRCIWEVPKTSTSTLATLFRLIETNKIQLGVATHTISDSSLDAIFVSMNEK